MKAKTTRRALLMSALSLLLCASMLVGTTFAWFTDSVTSGRNTIQAGNLDVVLEYWDGDSYEEVTSTTKLFDDAALWEPGYTEVAYLKVSNAGSLALKYQLAVNVYNETLGKTKDGADIKLSDHLQFKVVESDTDLADTYTRETAKNANATATKLQTYSSDVKALVNTGDTDYVALIIYMPETVGNEANHNGVDVPSIEMGVNLFATQQTSESDSFDDQYDKDAEFSVDVKNADELANALKVGGKVKLVNDITTGTSLAIPAGVAVDLDLNGKTLTGTMHKSNGAVISNKGNLTIKGGTVKSTAPNGGSALQNAGTANVVNSTLNGASNADGSWPSYTVNNTGKLILTDTNITSVHGGVASYGDGAVVTMNNTNLNMSGIPGFTSHGLYTYNNGQIVVNGGNIANNAADQAATGASVINGAVTVNAGTFNGRIEDYYGTPVIKGGTFSVNPKASFVAPGYQVTNNGDGTWSVGAYKISTGDELVDAIANGKAVELTQDVSLGKIDLTDAITNDVVIDANGHKITTTDAYGIEVTAGKNVTISNADVEMTKEGDYITYAAGFKVANGDYAGYTITLKNCAITMANTDWAYAVNMPAGVKNLNLVIDNCTLEGAIAVQCWGDNNTVTITNSKLICNYTTSALYTSYCVALQEDSYYMAENNTFVIDNCEFLYSGIDNFNKQIYAVADVGSENNTITVTNCTYGEKVVACY